LVKQSSIYTSTSATDLEEKKIRSRRETNKWERGLTIYYRLLYNDLPTKKRSQLLKLGAAVGFE
jgi:hypothetical protein